MESKAALAVEISDLFFQYSQNGAKVLENFSVSIPKGSIFSLIGPSGCGKTTLIRLVIGLTSATQDGGSIRLFGLPVGHHRLHIPGHNVGYMPQEEGLDHDLTIRQMIAFFGKLYGLNSQVLEERKNKLLRNFDIRDENCFIGSLSGGQKRRVSFLCATLHMPKLMVLDEPTVACDPIVAEKMWKYLAKLSKENQCTVIVTTHYLEESRKGDLIGFMRKGQLWEQASPSEVLAKFNVSTIEAAFHMICTRGDQSKFSRAIGHWSSDRSNCSPSPVDESYNNLQDPKRSLGGLRNYARLLSAFLFLSTTRYRNMAPHLVVLSFMILWLNICTFIAVGGPPLSIKIGVINYEDPQWASLKFLEILNGTEYVNLIPYEDLSKAQEDALKGHLQGFLLISRDFLTNMAFHYTWKDSLALSPFDETSIPFRHNSMVYHGNSINRQIEDFISHLFDQSIQNSSPSILAGVKINPSLGKEVLQGKWSWEEEIKVTKMTWLVKGVFFWFYAVIMAFAAVIILRDRSYAVFNRAKVSGATALQFLVSHIIADSILAVLVIPTVIWTLYLAYWDFENWTLIGTVFLMNTFCSITTGLLFGCGFDNNALLVIFSASYVIFGLSSSAILWPKITLPYFVEGIPLIFSFSPLAEKAIQIAFDKASEASTVYCARFTLVYMAITLTGAFLALKRRY